MKQKLKNIKSWLYYKFTSEEYRFYKKVDKMLKREPLKFSHIENVRDWRWYIFKSGKIEVSVNYCYGYTPFSARLENVKIDITPLMHKQVDYYFNEKKENNRRIVKERFNSLMKKYNKSSSGDKE